MDADAVMSFRPSTVVGECWGGVESSGSLETKVVISRGFWKDAKVWVDTADTLRSDFVDPQHLPFWLCFKCYTLADSFSAMLRIILAVRT